MNLHIINEAFKRNYSDVLTESVELSCKEELRAALKNKAMDICANCFGCTEFERNKKLEFALQGVIEDFFPDKCWWEVTSCNIFMDLLAGEKPAHVCDNIIDKLNDNCCEDISSSEYSEKVLAEASQQTKLAKNERGEYLVRKEEKWEGTYQVFTASDVHLATFNCEDDNRAKEKFGLGRKDWKDDPGYEMTESVEESFEEAASLKEDLTLETIKEEYVYLPTPDGKANVHVMLTCESFEDEVQYGIDIDWGSASKLADKISKAIWKYSYGDDRYIHIGENYVEISQKGFVESWCCWNDEDLDVIEELYDAIIEGLVHIDASEDLEEAVSNPERTISKVDKNLAKEVDKDLVRDLTLILENEGEVYRRSIVPVINNLKKKKAKGQFDEKLAIQAFFHVVEGALKQSWFKHYYSYSISTVSVPERYAVAKELLDGFMEEIEFEDATKHENLSISKIRK